MSHFANMLFGTKQSTLAPPSHCIIFLSRVSKKTPCMPAVALLPQHFRLMPPRGASLRRFRNVGVGSRTSGPTRFKRRNAPSLKILHRNSCLAYTNEQGTGGSHPIVQSLRTIMQGCALYLSPHDSTPENRQGISYSRVNARCEFPLLRTHAHINMYIIVALDVLTKTLSKDHSCTTKKYSLTCHHDGLGFLPTVATSRESQSTCASVHALDWWLQRLPTFICWPKLMFVSFLVPENSCRHKDPPCKETSCSPRV